MAIMKDNLPAKLALGAYDVVIAEGDRFTNSTFINDFKPYVLRIKGNGVEGRLKRGSNQTERHLKSMTTRVNNVEHDLAFENSTECLTWLIKQIANPQPLVKSAPQGLF